MDLKDIKQINVKIPDHLNELKPDLQIIINTTNTIITKYLEKQIYKSAISDSNKEKINTIFTNNKQLILEPFLL